MGTDFTIIATVAFLVNNKSIEIIMRISPFALPVACICMVSASVQAADSVHSVLTELSDSLVALNSQLDTIKDKDSATAAAPEIEKIGTKFAALSQKLMKSEDLTPPAPQDILGFQEIQTKMMEANKKFQANLMRIQQGGFVTPELEKALMSLKPAAPAPAPAAAK